MLIRSEQTAGLGWFHTLTARREPRLALRSQAASRCSPCGVGGFGGAGTPAGRGGLLQSGAFLEVGRGGGDRVLVLLIPWETGHPPAEVSSSSPPPRSIPGHHDVERQRWEMKNDRTGSSPGTAGAGGAGRWTFQQPALLCGSELLLHGDIPISWGVLSISWGVFSTFFGDISTFSQQGEAARHGHHLPCPDGTPMRCWLNKLPISHVTVLCWLSPR